MEFGRVMVPAIRNWLATRRKTVQTAEQLADFLSRQAAFIAQKCTDDYCRGKVGVTYYALAEEMAFKEALAVCRWEGFAAVLAGLILAGRRFLAESGVESESIDPALAALYARILATHKLPTHRPQGWDDAVDAFRARIDAARTDQPALGVLATAAAARLFEVLPIHQRYRELDEEVIHGAIQFQFVAFSDRFRREVDAAAVAGSLVAGPPGAEP